MGMWAEGRILNISGFPEGSINVNILNKSKTDRYHHCRNSNLSNDLLIGLTQWIFTGGRLTFELYSIYRIVRLSVNSATQSKFRNEKNIIFYTSHTVRIIFAISS